ncbi:MAG: glycogen synthase GlgA [Marinosulfonomonas sp.]
MIKTLSVTSECAPFVKTGGLADVAGALPAALGALDVQMRTLLPGYPAVMQALKQPETVLTVPDIFGGEVRVLAETVHGVDLLVVDAPHLYDRPGNIYLDDDGKDWADNPQRFSALCQVAALIAREGVAGWRPDICHGHDWQAGLMPEYLQAEADRPATMMTIHNIAFQGLAQPSLIGKLGLDPYRFTQAGYEYWGKVSALKAGLMSADRITTVSQTYADELTTSEFGMGLEGVIRSRRDDLSGIVNGIDDVAWNPETDTAITPYKTFKGKAVNKSALQAELGLPAAKGPLCVVVSRLTQQKGLDLLLQALPTLLERGGQLAVLGTGDPALEAAFRAEARHDNVAVHIGYDEAMSHRMIAGGDAILVPSRFEPCGLTQLYGLRYGTVPLVALTGGLADTVINASPAALAVGSATGVQFAPVTADALTGALGRMCDLFEDKKVWEKMQRNGMKQPVSWDISAKAYAAIYQDMLAKR